MLMAAARLDLASVLLYAARATRPAGEERMVNLGELSEIDYI